MAQHWIGRSWQSLVLGLVAVVVLAVSSVLVLVLHGHSGSGSAARASRTPITPASTTRTPTPAPTTPASTTPAPTTPAPTSSAPSTTPHQPSHKATRTTATPSRSTPPRASTRAARARPTGLPLDQPTGAATQAITVVAPSTVSDTATVRAWTLHGSRWLAVAGPIAAHIGTDGLTTQPSESRSATPMGSFTLTQAFGAAGNPGTSLPYLQTNPSDWWISQPGSLYNTHQRCSSDCAFVQGAPNEHMYYEAPSYNYGVVIDYNTANAGPVVQGAGSAFFLHVFAGVPSAGCVAIPQENLVSILRWLKPADHPRILIGAAG